MIVNQSNAVSLSLNIRVSEVLWRTFMIAIPGDLEKQHVALLRAKAISTSNLGARFLSQIAAVVTIAVLTLQDLRFSAFSLLPRTMRY